LVINFVLGKVFAYYFASVSAQEIHTNVLKRYSYKNKNSVKTWEI